MAPARSGTALAARRAEGPKQRSAAWLLCAANRRCFFPFAPPWTFRNPILATKAKPQKGGTRYPNIDIRHGTALLLKPASGGAGVRQAIGRGNASPFSRFRYAF